MDTCIKCGQPIALLEVATDGYTGVAVMRWCSGIVPYAICRVSDRDTGSQHTPARQEAQ